MSDVTPSGENGSGTRGARVYTLLGVLAILHSAIVFTLDSVLMAKNSAQPAWYAYVSRLNAGLATIWFFWPIILALHVGRSPRRAYISLIAAAAIFLVPGTWYFRVSGAALFAPEMLSLSPYDLGGYAIAYVRGWVGARKEVKAGRLILESYGFGVYTPGAPPLSQAVLAKYPIEVNAVTGCVVDTYILGHAAGYNRVSAAAIRERFGDTVIPAAEREEAKRKADYAAAEKAGRVDAEREIRTGRLAFELIGQPFTDEVEYQRMLKEKYNIELRRVSEAENENTALGHKGGYNDVAWRETERRFGHEPLDALIWAESRRPFEEFLQRRQSVR